MDKTESETEKLNPDQVSSAPNISPGYGAVSSGFAPAPPPYGPNPTGYVTPMGRHLYPITSPYHQGYSPLPNEGDVYVNEQTTVVLVPVHQPDYICFSIFTMLCCCLPLGIAALVYSIMTQESNQRGDAFAASKHSRMARILNYLALGLGIFSLVISIIVVIVVLQNSSHVHH